MNSRIHADAGKPASARNLVDVSALLEAYTDLRPDPSRPDQRVRFGTSGHRGVSFERSFNEWHVLAMTQAVCDYRRHIGVAGPLYLGFDTHALSMPAFITTLEVLAANAVVASIAPEGDFTPTPRYRMPSWRTTGGRDAGQADGVVITPSHNPPDTGGYKYNGVNGGPADETATGWIEHRANHYLDKHLHGVKRMPYARALRADTTHRYDFRQAYVTDLGSVIDFDIIRDAGLHVGVDPMGGAGVNYWPAIAEHYRISLDVVSDVVDPTFGFMTLDWDGKIRMDPSSPYAMQRLVSRKDRYDIAFGCDTDHDRHGIVVRKGGLMPPNHYLTVMIDYLFNDRTRWRSTVAVGKTVVSSALIDRLAARLGRRLYEVPVGFKWFVDGLYEGNLGFAGEESAGSSFLRRNGKVWTTDKDGITAGLLAVEMTARRGVDPVEIYRRLTDELGTPYADRIDVAANAAQKACLGGLSREAFVAPTLAGETVESVEDHAPGNDAPIGGIKVVTADGWFAVRPSGTEDLMKLYGESFDSARHLQAILHDAQQLVEAALRNEA